jgi:hypothetical protein
MMAYSVIFCDGRNNWATDRELMLLNECVDPFFPPIDILTHHFWHKSRRLYKVTC